MVSFVQVIIYLFGQKAQAFRTISINRDALCTKLKSPSQVWVGKMFSEQTTSALRVKTALAHGYVVSCDRSPLDKVETWGE